MFGEQSVVQRDNILSGIYAINVLSQHQSAPDSWNSESLQRIASSINATKLLSDNPSEESLVAAHSAFRNFATTHNIQIVQGNKNPYEFILVCPLNNRYIAQFNDAGFRSTARQVAAARMLLGLSSEEVSKESGVKKDDIHIIESVQSLNSENAGFLVNEQIKLLKFYASKGVGFFPPSPSKNAGEAIALKVRHEGVKSFGQAIAELSNPASSADTTASTVNSTDIVASAPKKPDDVKGKPTLSISGGSSKVSSIVTDRPKEISLKRYPVLKSALNINSSNQLNWNGENFEVYGVHFKMIRQVLDLNADDFSLRMGIGLQDYMEIEQRRRLSVQVNHKKHGLLKHISSDDDIPFSLIPACEKDDVLLHGEGIFALSDKSAFERLILSIQLACQVIRPNLVEICQRAGISHDIIDIWMRYTEQEDETLLRVLEHLLSAEELSDVLSQLVRYDIKVIDAINESFAVGFVFTEVQQMLPVESENSVHGFSNDTLNKEVLSLPTIASQDCVMSPAQFKVACGLLKLHNVDLKAFMKKESWDTDIDYIELPIFPPELLKKSEQSLDSWLTENEDDWIKIHKAFEKAGVIFIHSDANSSKQYEGAVFKSATTEWNATSRSQRILTGSQLRSAREMLFHTPTEMCYQCDISRRDLLNFENSSIGVPLLAKDFDQLIYMLFDMGIGFIRGTSKHGEGVYKLLNIKSTGEHKPRTRLTTVSPVHAASNQLPSAAFSSDSKIATIGSGSDKRQDNNSSKSAHDLIATHKLAVNDRSTSDHFDFNATIDGSVFLFARSISGIDHDDLIDKFGHKHFFLNSLEQMSDVQMNKRNVKTMLDYFAAQDVLFEVKPRQDAHDGMILIDPMTINIDRMMNRLITVLPNAYQAKFESQDNKTRFETLGIFLKQMGFAVKKHDGKVVIIKFPKDNAIIQSLPNFYDALKDSLVA